MTDDEILVGLGANNLYRKAVEVYTEAVTNNTNLNKSLSDLFSEEKKIVGPGLGDEDESFGLSGFIELVTAEYKGLTKSQKSYNFLKDKYDFYGIEYPPEGFFDVSYGPTNWWEKTTQYNQGVFSYTHVFNFHPNGPVPSPSVSPELISTTAIKGEQFKKVLPHSKINFSNFISSTDEAYESIREYLIDNTIAKFVEENENSQLAVLLENEKIKKTYFKFLTTGFKLSSQPNNTASTLKIRTFFDVYGAKLALSITELTGIDPIPMVPSGIRKNFLVRNFIGGTDAVRQLLEEKKMTGPSAELIKSQFKTLKDIFKKIVKDEKLSQDSTVGFVFNTDYEYLMLVDGNNKSIGNKKLKDFLKTNKKLNDRITKLNQINCQLGGNATGEAPEPAPEISFPFTADSPDIEVSREERKSQYIKQKSKSQFTGDAELRKILKATAPSSISSMYEDFFNKIDVQKLSKFVKSSLASKLSEDQLKKVKFEAYIESLDITEIIDCIVGVVTPFYHDKLALQIYDSFSYFYNIAKEDDDDTFTFIMKGLGLPRPTEGVSFNLNLSFPYMLMIPEEQKEKIFSTIVGNNPQYKNHPDLNKMGLIEISKRNDFVPEKFITFAMRRATINYAFGLSNEEFKDFYSQLSKQNKKLDASFSSTMTGTAGKDFDNYKSKQKANRNINKRPNFGWFDKYIPTLGYNDFISDLLNSAQEAAMLTILGQMVDGLKGGAEKGMIGDPNDLERADPAAFPLLASNDPVQNIIDSNNNSYNSPQDVTAALAASLFRGPPPASPDAVMCFLTKFSNEVNFFIQAKLFKNPTKINDPDVEIVRGILASCDLPSDDDSITNLLLELSLLIDSDLLELKLQEMNQALLEYLDICEDPNENYIENLKKFLDDASAESQAANESDAAAKKLLDLLSLLDGDRIKNSAPSLYCKFGSNKRSIFDNQYTEITLDSQDRLMTSTLKSINQTFNQDISKFKPIVLRQDKKDPLSALGLSIGTGGGDIMKSKFGKFLKKINNDEIGSGPGNSGLPEKTTIIEDSLTSFIENYLVFDRNNFNILSEENSDITVYRLQFSYQYFYLLSNAGPESVYDFGSEITRKIPAESLSTFLYDTKTKKVTLQSEDSEYTKKIADYSDISNDIVDFIVPNSQKATTFVKDISSLETPPSKNIMLKLLGVLADKHDVIKPDAEADIDESLLGVILSPSNWEPFIRSVFQNIFSGILAKQVDTLDVFDDKKFLDIPLKDTEAKNIFAKSSSSKRFYRDGGIISIPAVFEDFKVLRETLQCFIEKGTTPDAYQIAKLNSLYQALINVLVIQEFLNVYFTIFVQDDYFGLKEDELRKTIRSKVTTSLYANSVFTINNFHLNLAKDFTTIYKYEQLQNGIPTKRLFKKDTQGNVSFDPTISEGGTTAPMNGEEQFSTAIEYYIDKYYQKIYDKLLKRVSLSIDVPNKLSNSKDLIFPSKPVPIYSYAHNLNNYLFEPKHFSYTDVPLYVIDEEKTGQRIYNGLVVQTYVDIRQKQATLSPDLNFQLTPEGAIDYENNFLFNTYFLGDGPISDNVYKGAFSKTVSPYKIKVEKSNQKEGENPKELSVSELEDVYANYKKYYLRTQGKISFDDFERHYKDAYDKLQSLSEQAEAEAASLNWAAQNNAKNGEPTATEVLSDTVQAAQLNSSPGQHFEKIAVGARICLVLDDSDDLAKQVEEIFAENCFRNNGSSQVSGFWGGAQPLLSDEKFYDQLRILFNEKVFSYKKATGSRKIIIPLSYKEIDVLAAATAVYENENTFSLSGIYTNISTTHNELLTMLDQNPTGAGTVFKDELIDPVKESFNPKIFDDLLPISLRQYFVDFYGDKLNKVFDPTVQEIIGIISLSQSAINKDWKAHPILSLESAFAGDDQIKDRARSLDGYTPLAFSLLPLIVAAAATFSDPTWKTPWFWPGPVTPLGFLAKILNP